MLVIGVAGQDDRCGFGVEVLMMRLRFPGRGALIFTCASLGVVHRGMAMNKRSGEGLLNEV